MCVCVCIYIYICVCFIFILILHNLYTRVLLAYVWGKYYVGTQFAA